MIDQLKNGKFIIIGESKVHRTLHDLILYHKKVGAPYSYCLPPPSSSPPKQQQQPKNNQPNKQQPAFEGVSKIDTLYRGYFLSLCLSLCLRLPLCVSLSPCLFLSFSQSVCVSDCLFVMSVSPCLCLSLSTRARVCILSSFARTCMYSVVFSLYTNSSTLVMPKLLFRHVTESYRVNVRTCADLLDIN